MNNLYARSVFFVKDGERSLNFYKESLGFSLDWKVEHEGRAFVFQVSLFGFELILNQIEVWTSDRPGHGRVFIGLDDNQMVGFRQHVENKSIETKVIQWGSPTVVIRDLDQNELFFWYPESERARLEAEIVGPA